MFPRGHQCTRSERAKDCRFFATVCSVDGRAATLPNLALAELGRRERHPRSPSRIAGLPPQPQPRGCHCVQQRHGGRGIRSGRSRALGHAGGRMAPGYPCIPSLHTRVRQGSAGLGRLLIAATLVEGGRRHGVHSHDSAFRSAGTGARDVSAGRAPIRLCAELGAGLQPEARHTGWLERSPGVNPVQPSRSDLRARDACGRPRAPKLLLRPGSRKCAGRQGIRRDGRDRDREGLERGSPRAARAPHDGICRESGPERRPHHVRGCRAAQVSRLPG